MKNVIGSKVKFDITPEEKPKKAPTQKKTEKAVEQAAPVVAAPDPVKKDTESVTIRISKEEKKAFKALCAVRGVNMSDLLSEIVREYIQKNK